jgi:RimJ/RimL family protein N-acetyltransferase
MIQLLNANQAHIEVLIEAPDTFESRFGIALADGFTHFPEALVFMKMMVKEMEEEQGWWTFLPVLTTENKIIGTCGYKGAPNEAGEVEIGYEVADAYQGRGFATKMAGLLVEKAWQHPKVKTILAHTLAEKNASCRVLEKNGFTFIQSIHDPDDGEIWRWELKRT